MLTLPGLVNVWMLWDDRWSAFRRVFQAQLVSLACILLAVAVRFGDLAWERPSAALFAIGISSPRSCTWSSTRRWNAGAPLANL